MITGQEGALTSALNSAIIAAIEAQYGGSIMTPEYINALSAGIANAIIPFLVANVTVNATPVDPGSFSNSGGAVTGTGETDPGTIS